MKNNKTLLILLAGALLSTIATSYSMKDSDIKQEWARKVYTTDTYTIDLKKCPTCTKNIREIPLVHGDLFAFAENSTCVTFQGSPIHTDDTQCDFIPLWSFDTKTGAMTPLENCIMPQENNDGFKLISHMPTTRRNIFLKSSSADADSRYIEIKQNGIQFLNDQGTHYKLHKQLLDKHGIFFKKGQPRASLTSSTNDIKNAVIISIPYTKEQKKIKQLITVFGAEPCEFLCSLMDFKSAFEETVCANKNGSIVCHYDYTTGFLTVFKVPEHFKQVSEKDIDTHFKFN